jgi:hypothetical protein
MPLFAPFQLSYSTVIGKQPHLLNGNLVEFGKPFGL